MLLKFKRMLVSVAHGPFTLFHVTVIVGRPLELDDILILCTLQRMSVQHLIGLVIPFGNAILLG